MRRKLWAATGLVACGLAVDAMAQTFRPIDLVCVAYQFNPDRPWENGKMVYHTPVTQIIDRGNWVNELTILWHQELAKRGFVPSRFATAQCQGGISDPIGGVEIPWRPPASYSAKAGRPAAPPRVAETPSVKPSEPARSRAELVDTPAGQVLMTAEKKAAYEAKLAEQQRLAAERERIIAETAARHAANKAAAEAQQARHEQQLAEHRDKVAQMERDAAAVRAQWAQRAIQSGSPRKEDEPVEFKEGIVLCRQASAGSKSFGCQGPLQNVSTPLDAPGTTVALGQACGSDRSIRDLGMVKEYRAFGCGFGIHPTARDYPGNVDVPAKLGIDYVPGRGSYFCPKSKLAYCR